MFIIRYIPSIIGFISIIISSHTLPPFLSSSSYSKCHHRMMNISIFPALECWRTVHTFCCFMSCCRWRCWSSRSCWFFRSLSFLLLVAVVMLMLDMMLGVLSALLLDFLLDHFVGSVGEPLIDFKGRSCIQSSVDFPIIKVLLNNDQLPLRASWFSSVPRVFGS